MANNTRVRVVHHQSPQAVDRHIRKWKPRKQPPERHGNKINRTPRVASPLRDLGLAPAAPCLPRSLTWRYQDRDGTSLRVSSHSIPRSVARGRGKVTRRSVSVNPCSARRHNNRMRNSRTEHQPPFSIVEATPPTTLGPMGRVRTAPEAERVTSNRSPTCNGSPGETMPSAAGLCRPAAQS